MGHKRNAFLVLFVLFLSTIAASSLPKEARGQLSSLTHFASLTASPSLVIPGQTVIFNSTLTGIPVESVYGPDFKLNVLLNGTAVVATNVNLPFTSVNMTVSITQVLNTTGFAPGIYGVSGVLEACPRNILCNANNIIVNTINDGTVTVADPALSFSQTRTFHDVTATVNGNLIVDQSSHNLSGLIMVLATNNTSGAVIFTNTFSMSLSFTGNTIRFVLTIPSTPLTLAFNCMIQADSGSASCSLSRDPDIDHNGRVDVVDLATIAVSFASVLGSPTYNQAADLDADGRVDILDLSLDAIYFDAPVF